MKSKKILISISLSDYLKLREMAEKERLSISALVRMFIIRRLYNNYEGGN
jgi:hypothetical protein